MTFTMRLQAELVLCSIGRLSMVTLCRKKGRLLGGGVANFRLVFAAHLARFIFISNPLNIYVYVCVFPFQYLDFYWAYAAATHVRL